MIRIEVAPEARDDLKRIWRYLAVEAGVTVADRIREKVLTAFTALARSPGIGHKREDLTSLEVKFYPVYQLMIVYSHDPKPFKYSG